MLDDYHTHDQGQTIEKAVIDLGKSEANAGLTFVVCLSRAKRLVDHLVEPMQFDRLSKLGDKPTLRYDFKRKLVVETLIPHRVRLP